MRLHRRSARPLAKPWSTQHVEDVRELRIARALEQLDKAEVKLREARRAIESAEAFLAEAKAA
jgi:hypothetical protein